MKNIEMKVCSVDECFVPVHSQTCGVCKLHCIMEDLQY